MNCQLPLFKTDETAYCDQIMAWSNQNSGSNHLEGLKKMAKRLGADFSCLGTEAESIELPPRHLINDSGEPVIQETGPLLTWHKRPEAPVQILLCGHYDTVFSPDHPFQEAKLEKPNILHGPGVADMKGGLLVMREALAYLETLSEASQLGWRLCLNPDEEVGSLSSSPYLAHYAKTADYGLVFEPALNQNGDLASQRRGSGLFSLIVKGQSAHIGRCPEAGRSAIVGLAELISKIHALNHQRPSIFINIGYCQGGGILNQIPDLALAKLAIRTDTLADEAWCLDQIQKLIKNLSLKYNLSIDLKGHFHRPPKPFDLSHQQLFNLIRGSGSKLGLTIDWQTTGGCCDGNNLAAQGLTTIDTLGVRGGGLHSSDEYLYIDSLSERIRLTVQILLDLGKAHRVLR